MLDELHREAVAGEGTARDLGWMAGAVMLRETGMPIADIRVIADLSRREDTETERRLFFEQHRAARSQASVTPMQSRTAPADDGARTTSYRRRTRHVVQGSRPSRTM